MTPMRMPPISSISVGCTQSTSLPGELRHARQPLAVLAAHVEIVVARHREGIPDGVEVLDDRRALRLVADGRALEHVADIHQEHFVAGGLRLFRDLADVGRGRGAAAERRREVRIHELGGLGRNVAVDVVGPQQVHAQEPVILGGKPARGRHQAGSRDQEPQDAQFRHLRTPSSS
jgi:hypothetical protein